MMRFKIYLFLIMVLVMTGHSLSWAEPQLNAITHGEGSVEVNGEEYRFYQTTDKVIARFDSFDIDLQEIVRVLQPGQASAALFRILDHDASQILGTLNANGHLFLLNPHGILFGPNASVNVGGLVASSLDIRNEDFLMKRYLFSSPRDSSGYILNQGRILAQPEGSVSFLGDTVHNEGDIIVPHGSVYLISANEVMLPLDRRGLLQIPLEGTVQALEGGGIVLSRDVVNQAFDRLSYHEGLIEAQAVFEEDGVIVLDGYPEGEVKVTGSILVAGSQDGERGGALEIRGENILIEGDAILDASGDHGGGSIRVNSHGPLENAQNKQTYIGVGPDAEISADAISQGDGGQVVIWSAGLTEYYGHTQAKGAGLTGDGGFVEVSGKGSLEFFGTVDLRATNGNSGTLLLDPGVLILQGGHSDGAGDGNNTFGGASPGRVDLQDQLSILFESEIETQSLLSDIVLLSGERFEVSTSLNGSFENNDVVIGGGHDLIIGVNGDQKGYIDLTEGGNNAALEFKTLGGGDITILGSASNFSNPQGGSSITDVRVGKLTSSGNISVTTYNGKIILREDLQSNGSEGSIQVGGAVFGSSQNPKAQIVLENDVTFSTPGGENDDIVFEGRIDGPHLLNLDSGNRGDVRIEGNIGETRPLKGLTITESDKVYLSAINTKDNGVDVTSSGIITLARNIDSAYGINGGSVVFKGNVELERDVAIISFSAGQDGDIHFKGQVDADSTNSRTLTVHAGSEGLVNFDQSVGSTHPLEALMIPGASQVILNDVRTKDGGVDVFVSGGNPLISIGGNIDTTGGNESGIVSLQGPVRVVRNTSVNTHHSNGSHANIYFNGTLNADESQNARQLDVDPGVDGTVEFLGAIGAIEPLDLLVVPHSDEVVVEGGVIVSRLLLSTSLGLGTAENPLQINANQLEIKSNEDIYVRNTGNLTLGGISTVSGIQSIDGDIGVTVTGKLSMHSSAVVSTQEGNITLQSDQGMELALVDANSDLAGPRGNVLIQADTGSITDINDLNGEALNIRAESIRFKGAILIGTLQNPLEFDSSTVVLEANASFPVTSSFVEDESNDGVLGGSFFRAYDVSQSGLFDVFIRHNLTHGQVGSFTPLVRNPEMSLNRDVTQLSNEINITEPGIFVELFEE